MTNNMNSLTDDYSFIKQIQFANYSPEQIKKISVVNITKAQLYNSNGEPSPNGLFDPKMGYIEPRKRCRTCFKTLADCPGHIGHIELARPVFNIQYETETMKIMKSFCPKCNKLLINPNHHWVKNLVATTKNKRRERFEKISKFISLKIKQCGGPSDKDDEIYNPLGCGAIQPSKYYNKLKSDSLIILEWKVEGESNEVISQSLNAEMVHSIFKRISEDDANVLGFDKEWCHPSSLIITVLPVVPPCVRPSVKQYNSQRSEDDLTHKYNDIIKANETLKDKLSSDNNISPEHIKNYTDLLQYHITTLFNNNITGINPSKTRSGRPMKTLAERLKGKQGRIRHNLMGKRVDFSARSVISPDANIKIGELGVPLKVAMNLTFPEVVNKYNINQMYKLVRNGNAMYPGAKSIKSVKDKKTRLLEYRDTNSIVLEFGDIVNRHLLNGDTVLFNRQPSLHKMSMMAHKVRVIYEGNTFRLNIDVCTPYNADFDGDEMNMHVPQSYQTAIELDMIAAVPKHILSPSNMAPIIKPSQDNLLGIYKMTDNGVEFTHQELMNMLIGVEKFTGVLPEPEIKEGNYIRWTGRQLFSLILPPINIYKNNEDEPTKDNVLIENGILKQGQVDKSISGKIVHMIFNEYGYKEAERYLNDLQCITTRYMIRSGYSVGISDLVIHPDLKKRFQEEILKGKEQVIDVTKKTHLNILEDVNEGLDQIYESTVRKITSDIVGGITSKGKKSISKYNRIKFMVDSGSKGSSMNIQQMVFLLGEQSIDGKRVPLGFPDRSLPHFPRYENGIESRGFVANNFIDGLTPQELFFHAMAGREGLIDTAVKTANSGYLQRKLIKATEDLKVNHDYTVRSSNNDIVEFVYGSDGFYPAYLERQNTKLIKLDNDKLMNNYIIDENEKFETYVVKKEITKMKKNADYKKKISKYNNDVKECIDILYKKYALFYEKINNLVLYYPIDIAKKVDTVAKVFNLTSGVKSDISPIYVIDGIYEILNKCSVNDINNNTLRILLVDNLSPKRLLRDLNFNKIAFDFLKNAIMARFDDVLVEGGEMVGPLASQSIGEKSTQLTLNSVEWNTELLIEVDGVYKRVKIGEWIDSRIKLADVENIENHPNDTTLEYIKDCKVRVMAPTEDGNIIWDDVEAVTKHPVINKDGSNTLIKVTLDSGREIIATKGKSFLKRVNNKIKPVEGDKLMVGDFIPVSTIFAKDGDKDDLNEWDYSNYIQKDDFIYMSEIEKAYSEYQYLYVNKGIRHWFSNNSNFIIPYSRSDSFMEAYKSQFSKNKNNEKCRRNSNKVFRDKCVYPKFRSNKQSGHLTEKLELDENFGFFVGAYLAKGHCTKYQVLISNNDDDYIDKIKQFASKYDLKYHVVDINKNGGRSRTLRIHSYVLAQLIIKSMGKTSDCKRIPSELLRGNDIFLKGLIDGYISGDGTVNKRKSINVSSISQGLLYDIQNILLKYQIFTKIKPAKNAQIYNIKKGLKARLSYNMNLSVADSYKFKQHFKLTIKKKQSRLDEFTEPLIKYSRTDIVPDIDTMQYGNITIKRHELDKYINGSNNDDDIKVFEAVKNENIYYDKIVSIEDIQNEHEYVYDLTVKKTKSFLSYSGVCLWDTFHSAGVGEKSNVTRGVPRLHELLSNTKKPKNPTCDVYLEREYRDDIEMASKIGNNIECTTIGDLLLSDAIYLDKSNHLENVLPEDKDIMKIYEVFSKLTGDKTDVENNMWVIRLEFDRKKIIESKVSMSDIQLVLNNEYPDSVLMYMDDNASKLIFRIKLSFTNNPLNMEDDITYLKDKIEEIKTIMVKGVNNITKVYYIAKNKNIYYEKVGDLYEERQEIVINTDGSNLFDILMIDGVDKERTYSIDPNEMNSVFGIEAARYMIENQITDVLEGSRAMTSPRHVSLLCNKMTNGGNIMSVDRHGINKENIGPLAKSSFEETTDQLLVASLFGDIDDIKGVSANIMVGQIPSCGTGDSKIILDEEMLITQEKDKYDEDDEDIDFNAYFEASKYCEENDQMRFNINAIKEEDIEIDDLPDIMVE